MGHGGAGEVIRDLHLHTPDQPRTPASDYVRRKVGALDPIRDVLEETLEWYRKAEKEGQRSIKRHRRDSGIR